MQAWGDDEAEAERIASEVIVRSDGVLRAEGPEQRGRSGWSVNYEVLAPREIDLTLETHNGGIAVANVRGELAFEARNGGISIDSVAGNVRGRTTNGGVDATLAGDTWDGAGLDLEDHERRRSAACSGRLLRASRNRHRQRRHRHRLSRDGARAHRP